MNDDELISGHKWVRIWPHKAPYAITHWTDNAGINHVGESVDFCWRWLDIGGGGPVMPKPPGSPMTETIARQWQEGWLALVDSVVEAENAD